MSTPMRTETAALRRLRELEAEIDQLRRALGAELIPSAELPRGRFQALMFRVRGALLAAPITYVQEVIRMVKLAEAKVAPGVRGLLDLRGEPIAVLDLSERLGWGATPLALDTPIVVCRHGSYPLGLLVHDVRDILEVDSDELCALEEVRAHESAALAAYLRTAEGIVQLIDPFRLLAEDEARALGELLEAHAEDSGEGEPGEAEELDGESNSEEDEA